MTRSLTDAAIVLSVIAGKDPNDNFTLAQPPVVPDFTKALNKNALKGKRIGVPRRVFLNDSITGNDPSINVAYEKALLTIKALGATVVDPADLPSADEFVTSNNETIVLNVDFKVWICDLLCCANPRICLHTGPTKRIFRGAVGKPIRRQDSRGPD
jgi:amidase